MAAGAPLGLTVAQIVASVYPGLAANLIQGATLNAVVHLQVRPGFFFESCVCMCAHLNCACLNAEIVARTASAGVCTTIHRLQSARFPDRAIGVGRLERHQGRSVKGGSWRLGGYVYSLNLMYVTPRIPNIGSLGLTGSQVHEFRWRLAQADASASKPKL